MTEAAIQTPPATRVFCRNELNTRDPEKAIEFFTALCGWATEPDKLGEFDYHWFVKDGVRFGGMIDMSSQKEWGEMPPLTQPGRLKQALPAGLEGLGFT